MCVRFLSFAVGCFYTHVYSAKHLCKAGQFQTQFEHPPSQEKGTRSPFFFVPFNHEVLQESPFRSFPTKRHWQRHNLRPRGRPEADDVVPPSWTRPPPPATPERSRSTRSTSQGGQAPCSPWQRAPSCSSQHVAQTLPNSSALIFSFFLNSENLQEGLEIIHGVVSRPFLEHHGVESLNQTGTTGSRFGSYDPTEPLASVTSGHRRGPTLGASLESTTATNESSTLRE